MKRWHIYFQEIFDAIDDEKDNEVYMKQVVVHLRTMDTDIDRNLRVSISSVFFFIFKQEVFMLII